MKKQRTSGGIILTYALSIVTTGLFGQVTNFDKMIIDIEAFKKYHIIKIDNKDDLKLLSDSTAEVTEIVNYWRENKNNHSGKVTENSKTKFGEVKRTYYFNKQSELFAIIDHIKININTTNQLTYSFGGGQLISVIDENKNDVSSNVNKQQLYDLIRRRFDGKIIAK